MSSSYPGSGLYQGSLLEVDRTPLRVGITGGVLRCSIRPGTTPPEYGRLFGRRPASRVCSEVRGMAPSAVEGCGGSSFGMEWTSTVCPEKGPATGAEVKGTGIGVQGTRRSS